MKPRVYLDWNASAPLRVDAHAAMLSALDIVGNPSSVHAEGRAVRAMMETARAQVAALVGIDRNEVVFTSGATEAVALACGDKSVACSDVEHDCVQAHQDIRLQCGTDGIVVLPNGPIGQVLALQSANSETGILQSTFAGAQSAWTNGAAFLVDAVQAAGKMPLRLDDSGADFMALSAHKLGGPKGVGALALKLGVEVAAVLPGGGQEQGRRSGTENLLGIVGFGAAAAAARRDIADGVWDRVKEIRNILESAIAAEAPETIFVGQGVQRLPNTSCFIAPGWKGETQVMAMDLAGFAISAGSACSSGKVRASRVLRAMGFDEAAAMSAVRVSIGPATTEDEVLRFAQTWCHAYRKVRARAA